MKFRSGTHGLNEELQGVAGGRSEFRCLGGETDTSVSVCSFGLYSFVNGSTHYPGCVVDGPSAMAAT